MIIFEFEKDVCFKEEFSSRFTLIELLVVIAIISILMAILLPSLKSAKDKSYSINCVGNQRQIGVAFNSYVGDSDGMYPYYWQYEDDTSYYPMGWKCGMLWNYLPNNEIWYCPSEISSSPYYGSTETYFDNPRPGYGYNYGGIGCSAKYVNATKYAIHGWRGPSARAIEIKKPSQTILMADSYKGGNGQERYGSTLISFRWYDISSGNDFKYSQMVANRHQGAVNVLWIDGHVNSNHTSNNTFPYVDSNNPYLCSPFTNGVNEGNAENYFDRY